MPATIFDAGEVGRTLAGLTEAVLARTPYAVIALFAFLLTLLAGRVAKWVFHVVGRRTRLDPMLADLFGSLAYAASAVLGVFVAAVIVFPNFHPGDLVAGLGITSIAVGFAFRDLLQNLMAGIVLLYRKPFRVGDQVRTGDHEGTVEEITVRCTVLRTYDGERVLVPNGDVYTNTLVVRTAYGKRRSRFTVGVGYPDSLEEARSVIRGVLAETEGVLAEPEPWVHVTELAPSAVNFAVYF